MAHSRLYAHGPQRLPDGVVHFRLWAPGSQGVALHVGDETLAMNPAEGGWFEARVACPVGTPYCFEADGSGLRVPDPASHMQEDDVHGRSIVVDHGAYAWRNTQWLGRPWHETVIYEAHVGLMGGFKGLRKRLPQLAELGITAVELMPVADFPGARNWGYDGVLPYAPDRAYGTPDELKALIDEAHGLGLMVFLDVVYNHFGPVGNYLPSYAPQFFREDIATPWGAAIDFRQPAVRSYFADNALYWLKEYQFDGLRFDAVHAIVEKEEWLQTMVVELRKALPGQRCVHLVLENDDNTASLLRHGFDAQWNDDAHHVVHHLLTGESHGYYAAYADRATEKLARALAQGFIYQGEPSPTHGGKPRGEPSYMLPPTAFVFFLQNHDQVGNRAQGDRLAELCRETPQALEAAVALQLLCPAIPLLFMGEELGATNPFLYFTSFDDPDFAAKVREGRRAEFADFHRETGLEIPDPNAEHSWRTSLLAEPKGESAQRWKQLYTSLLSLRREHVIPGLRDASSETVDVLGNACLVARWALDNGRLLSIYCNLSPQAVQIVGGLDPNETVFHESSPGAAEDLRSGLLGQWCTVASLASLESPEREAL